MSATYRTGERAFLAWRIHGNTLQALVLARLSALSRKATAYTKALYSHSEPASRKAWPPYTRLHVSVRHVCGSQRGSRRPRRVGVRRPDQRRIRGQLARHGQQDPGLRTEQTVRLPDIASLFALDLNIFPKTGLLG